MDLNYNPVTETEETFEEGLIDLRCKVKTYSHLPGKKTCRVLQRRINPDRTAQRALTFCGTRYRR